MENRILVLGLGNVLLNDEGIGVRAIQHLEDVSIGDNVDILDGGTGGFVLLSLFQDYDTIIIIDATLNDDKPGSIKVLEPKYSSDFPKSLSTHELGMKDMIESAMLLEKVPKLYLLAVTIAPQQDMDMRISPQMEAIIPDIHQKILEIIEIINNQ